jgi:hypothetical protein
MYTRAEVTMAIRAITMELFLLFLNVFFGIKILPGICTHKTPGKGLPRPQRATARVAPTGMMGQV